jgi:hypothetical protein
MLFRWFGITFTPSPWRLVERVDEAFVTGDAISRDKGQFPGNSADQGKGSASKVARKPLA